MPEDLYSVLGPDLEAVKDVIRNRLYSRVELLDNVNKKQLENPGKTARPTLSLLMARACSEGRSTQDSILLASAVELLHNSTLLHDDVADESDTRRGAPTVMSLYGPVPAVLVGDFWLARTLGVVLDSNHPEWAIKAFAKTLTDLAEGEMLQQQKALSGDTTEDDYLQIIYGKTASLFELSCTCAAKSVDASPEMYEAAARYGKAIGLAFQIKDDILDYQGVGIGKPIGQDLLERKITLPLLGALKGASNEAEIRKMVTEIPAVPQHVQAINSFVLENGGLEYAGQVLRDYVTSAIEALSGFPASMEKTFLEEFAHINELRTK